MGHRRKQSEGNTFVSITFIALEIINAFGVDMYQYNKNTTG